MCLVVSVLPAPASPDITTLCGRPVAMASWYAADATAKMWGST